MSASRIAENLARIRQRMAAAARRGGREPHQVRLVAVTKYASFRLARALVESGCRELGESRPQDLWAKAAALADLDVAWHLVGHLQRNKIRRTLPLAALIHSVDSLRTLLAMERIAAELERRCPVLLEVNTSGEPTKSGFSPAELASAWFEFPCLEYVEIRGLMTIAALEGGAAARRNFCALRDLRDRLAARPPPGVRLDELSMGMSGDFEIAIEEGATIVRIGSALFEGVAEPGNNA